MAKLLKIKDKILLGLAVLGDLSFQVAEPLSIQIKKIYQILPQDYKITNFYGALNRLYKTNDIEKIIKRGKPYIRLTGQGRHKLTRDFPLLAMQQKPWDDLWRVVIFDIPEKYHYVRDLLRNKLASLGFGKLQRSVYITPFDVAQDLREFLAAKNLSGYVLVMVSKEVFTGNLLGLTSWVWQLDKINQAYQKIHDNWLWAKTRFEPKNLRGIAKSCYRDYIEVISQDPFLPKELLSTDWLGFEAKGLVKEWIKYL